MADRNSLSEFQPAAEFQALPLEYLVSAPLTAAVKAQRVAAETSLEFINGLKDDTAEFEIESQGALNTKTKVKAPLLALVHVPHLQINSLTTHFRFEISQTLRQTDALDKGATVSAKSGGLLSPWVDASLSGSVTSKSSEESTTNRSGVLDITIHASEAPMPEGLAKIISAMVNSIKVGG